MYKEILRSIAGIEIYPVISLVVFVTFFTLVLVRVVRMDRSRVDRLARLPLDGDGAAGQEGVR